MHTSNLSTSTLAFVGDAAFTLAVRLYLARAHDYKSGELTKIAATMVSAKNQSRLALAMESEFDDEERDIYKRCKNAHTNNIAKNASVAEYHRATGLEGVMGYLILCGEQKRDRLEYIINKCIELSLKENK